MPDPVPATRKVQIKIAELAEAVTGARVYTDRGPAQPLAAHEVPGRVIRLVDDRLELYEGMTLHRATYHVSFQSGEGTTSTIDEINQRAIANFIASMHADRTLGGRLMSIEEQSISGSEEAGVDIGEALLELEALFFTPRGDLFTIVGQSGATF